MHVHVQTEEEVSLPEMEARRLSSEAIHAKEERNDSPSANHARASSMPVKFYWRWRRMVLRMEITNPVPTEGFLQLSQAFSLFG